MRLISTLIVLEPPEEVREAVKQIIQKESWGSRREGEFFYDKKEGVFIIRPLPAASIPSFPAPLLPLIEEGVKRGADRVDIEVGDVEASPLV